MTIHFTNMMIWNYTNTSLDTILQISYTLAIAPDGAWLDYTNFERKAVLAA